ATAGARPTVSEMVALVIVGGAVLLGDVQASQLLGVDAGRYILQPLAHLAHLRCLCLGRERQRGADPVVDRRQLRPVVSGEPHHQSDGHRESKKGTYTGDARWSGSRAHDPPVGESASSQDVMTSACGHLTSAQIPSVPRAGRSIARTKQVVNLLGHPGSNR